MINFLIFISTVLTIIAIVLIFYYISLFKKEDDEPEDKPQVINSMPKYANGHNKGVLNKIIEQGDWSAVEFFPRDNDYKKLKKEKKQIGTEVVFVPSNNLEWTPRGGWSNQVSDLIINPINEEDIPSALRKTSIGQGFIISAVKGEGERVEKRINDLKYENIEKIQKETRGMNILENFMEMEKKIRENMIIEKITKEAK